MTDFKEGYFAHERTLITRLLDEVDSSVGSFERPFSTAAMVCEVGILVEAEAKSSPQMQLDHAQVSCTSSRHSTSHCSSCHSHPCQTEPWLFPCLLEGLRGFFLPEGSQGFLKLR